MPALQNLRRSAIGLTVAGFLFTSTAVAEPASAFFNADGVNIHYVREGSGEPVVLIHGLYSSAAINWQMPGTFAALARNHDVIALDLPGHGLSDKPNDAAAYGDEMVEDVALLLDHLGIKQAHIAGYSLGGLVALKFVSVHPDRVLSGTLCAMGWMAEGGFLQRVWEHMDKGSRFSSTPPVCVTSIARLAMTKDQLLSVKAPMEIIIGDRDPVRQLYVVPLQGVRTDWPVVEITGAGHLTAFTKPDFINELVRWIEANRQR